VRAGINKPLRILLGTNGLILLAGAMFGPIFALFVEGVGGTLLDAGFAASGFALAAGITTLLVGRFTDSVKEKELIVVIGYIVMAVSFFSFSFVNSIGSLLVVQVLLGIGEAIYSPAFDGVYTSHIKDGVEGSAWGVWESMNYFIAAAGAALGGFFATLFGFTILFYIMAILCVISAVYIYSLPRRAL
jgi:MFS family permease